jgi:multidrug resistance efflux pump
MTLIRKSNQLEWERPLSKGSRWTFWLLIVLVISAAIWASIAQVQVYALVRGSLEPKGQTIAVDTPVSGRVLEVRTQLWGTVHKGDVLFVLDAVGTDATDTKLQFETLQAQAQEASRALEFAQADVRQRQRVVKDKVILEAAAAIPRVELIETQDALEKAQLSLRQAEAKLNVFKVQLAQSQRRQRIVIRSPTNGRISFLAVREASKAVGTGQGLATILPEGVPLQFRGFAQESDRPKLLERRIAEIAWNAYPRQKYGITVGQVSGIAPSSAPTFEVTIDFKKLELKGPEGSKELLPGMTGEARVIATKKTALALFCDWVRGVNPWD